MATFEKDQAVATTEDMVAEVKTGANSVVFAIPSGTAATVVEPNMLPDSAEVEVAIVEFSFDLTAVQMKIRKNVPASQLEDAS